MPTAPRLLFVFAHPDDESFTSAGLISRYVKNGATVALISATRGDAGRVGEPPLCSQAELPARREAELRRAAGHLGLKELYVLDYADKQLSKATTSQIRLELVQHIRAHRPHVIVTFDPNGMNGHPDHVAISRFTMDAIVAAGDPRYNLSEGHPHTTQRVLWTTSILPWEVADTPDLNSEPGVDFVVDVAPHRAEKIAALRSHRTQQVPIDRCFFSKSNVDEILGIEAFRQGWGPILTDVPSDDILAGLDLSE